MRVRISPDERRALKGIPEFGYCSTCNQTKLAIEFVINWKHDPPRLYKKCKECRRKKYKLDALKIMSSANQWYHRNKKTVRQKANADRRTNPRREMLRKAKRRSKRKHVPFALTIDDIAIPSICPVLGIPIAVSDQNFNNGSPSLDRIIPEKGYVPGNVIVVSFRANKLKNDATMEELKMIVKFYERFLRKEESATLIEKEG